MLEISLRYDFKEVIGIREKGDRWLLVGSKFGKINRCIS